MQYFSEMDDKYGFNDGESTPRDAEACRGVYIQVVNALAAKYDSKIRLLAFDRPGVHNSCLFLRVPVEEQNKHSKIPIDSNLVLGEPPSDEGMRLAIEEALEMDLDSYVEVKVEIDQKGLAKLLSTISDAGSPSNIPPEPGETS